jgi:hypothetical protein
MQARVHIFNSLLQHTDAGARARNCKNLLASSLSIFHAVSFSAWPNLPLHPELVSRSLLRALHEHHLHDFRELGSELLFTRKCIFDATI